MLGSAIGFGNDACVHMDAILRIAASVHADADANLTTDRHGPVDVLHLEFPLITRETRVALVEGSTRTIGGMISEERLVSSGVGASCARRHEVHAE
jgi:hypothetical protein